MDYINEGSTSYHSITPVNKAGEAVVPEAIRYRVSGDNGVQIADWATVNADATEIELSATINTISTTGKKRYLTVEITHGGGDKITEEILYTIRDLKGVVSP